MKKRNLEEILNSYREYLDEKVQDPLVCSRKREFLAAHFKPEPFWGFHPAFLVPAMALCVVFLWMCAYTPPRLEYIYPQPLVSKTLSVSIQSAVSAEEKTREDFQADKMMPVKIERLNSHVGPTMVFQSKRDNIPITIVWVFAGG